jgi:hypothetical protein
MKENVFTNIDSAVIASVTGPLVRQRLYRPALQCEEAPTGGLTETRSQILIIHYCDTGGFVPWHF